MQNWRLACRAGLGGLPTSAAQQQPAQARFGGGTFGQGLQQVRRRSRSLVSESLSAV